MTDSYQTTNQDIEHSGEIDERISLLKEIPFFKDLTKTQLTEIVKHLLARTFPAGKRVLVQDEPVKGVYFLQNGEIQVLVSNEQTGQEELITHGYKGECFGEMSTLRGELNASATVITTCECRFLYIDREEFLELVNNVNLWPQFVSVLASRLEQTNHRMTEVMKHLKQGMVQVDLNSLITGKFSMGFVRLIGNEGNELHGKSFPDLVFSDSIEQKKKWMDNYSLAITSDPDQASLILNLLPSECVFNHKKKGKRIFKISYDLCVYHKVVIGIDIGLEDVTRIRELDLKSRELEKEKNIVREIYTKPETFRTLLHLLDEIGRDIKSMNSQMLGTSISQEDLRYWLGNLHSLKGTSYFLNLDELGKAAHQMESLMVRFKNKSDSPAFLLAEYEKEKDSLENRMNYVNAILDGMSDETRKRLTAELILSKKETDNLESTLKAQPDAMNILLRAKKVSSHRLVEGWKEELERLCLNLPKKIVFRNIGEPISLPGDLFSRLKAPMVHLLRNCAEHGIESINDRKKSKKPSAGLISFSADYTNGQYSLHVQDNGKGVSKIHIIAKAEDVMKKGSALKQNIEKLLDENKILAILFLPGFSTKEKTTELSGRGVGLDVVQRAVSEAGGKIFMKTVPGKGTKFTMTFPEVP